MAAAGTSDTTAAGRLKRSRRQSSGKDNPIDNGKVQGAAVTATTTGSGTNITGSGTTSTNDASSSAVTNNGAPAPVQLEFTEDEAIQARKQLVERLSGQLDAMKDDFLVVKMAHECMRCGKYLLRGRWECRHPDFK